MNNCGAGARTKAVIAATSSLGCKQHREPHLAFVLLTAPKIFAISSSTGKNSRHNFARLSAWYFRMGGTPTPEMKTYSERNYKRTVRLRRRNTSRNGGEQISAELDGCTSDCAVLLRSWRTKRGGITRGRYLSMRVPLVFPASDGQFCRESTLYEWWKKYRRGPERWGNSI